MTKLKITDEIAITYASFANIRQETWKEMCEPSKLSDGKTIQYECATYTLDERNVGRAVLRNKKNKIIGIEYIAGFADEDIFIPVRLREKITEKLNGEIKTDERVL